MWLSSFTLLWLIVSVTTTTLPSMQDPLENARNASEYLLEKWQDWILANAIAINHLNCLLTLASRQDFAFTIPAGYSVKYISHPNSFRLTSSSLATQFRAAISVARGDLNRVHTGMQLVPRQMRKTLVFLKMAPIELNQMLFPDYFLEIEKLVNNSLVVLRRPQKSFIEVSEWISEIIDLLSRGPADESIVLQMTDIKTEWNNLVHLTSELSDRAEIMRESFLLQFNWIVGEYIRPGIINPDDHREFFIDLLLVKLIKIDQMCDLLGTIAETYTDMSYQWTDDEISDNAHLVLLNNEVERRTYLHRYRSRLPNQVVHISRLAMQRHNELLQRNAVRQRNFEKFLTDISMDDLLDFLSKQKD